MSPRSSLVNRRQVEGCGALTNGIAILKNVRTGEIEETAGIVPAFAIEVVDRGHELGPWGRTEWVEHEGEQWLVLANTADRVGISPE